MRSIPDKIFTRQDTFLYSPIHNLENILPFSENQSRELLKIFPSTYIHPFTQIVFNDVARNVNQRNVNRRFTLHSRTSLIRSERDRSSGWYSPEIAIGNVCVELKREREREREKNSWSRATGKGSSATRRRIRLQFLSLYEPNRSFRFRPAYPWYPGCFSDVSTVAGKKSVHGVGGMEILREIQ